MEFETQLVVEQLDDIDWKVMQPLRYQGNSDSFVVPTGSQTDFASVPKIFQWLLPRSGRYTKPAVLHDFLCRRGDQVGCPVNDADGIFRRSMAEMQVPFLKRWVMWAAVRWRSLVITRFKAGPSDIPQVVLVTIAPGLFIIAGGLVVFVLLFAWFLIEIIWAMFFALLRAVVPPVRARTKPTVRPKLRWTG
jgi:hypothetical protein